MNTISTFIISFCASSVIIGLLYILVPDNFKQILKFLFGIIFILSVISAFLEIRNFSVPSFRADSASSSSIELQTSYAITVYENTLRLKGINFEEIEVCTDKSEGNSIIITKVIIRTDEKRERVIAALGQVADNFEVEVINE